MRDLSFFEIGVVGGGIETVTVTGQSTDGGGGGLTQAAWDQLSFDMDATKRVVGETVGCSAAISKAKSKPTYTNVGLAASACSNAVADFFKSVDWKGLTTVYGAIQMDNANARSFGLVKQNRQ